jgi:hypothetical protein
MSSVDKEPIAVKQIDVACTLCARDYKGFGNQAINGVIEIERKKYVKNGQTKA